MKISVELTLTPLQDKFEPPIIDFIKRLRKSGLTILENPLSTQVYGDYNLVMGVLQTEIKKAFESQWAGERICSKCKSSAAWRQSYMD